MSGRVHPVTWVQRVLPDGRILWALSAAAFADAVGNGFFITGSAVFFTQYLDMSAGDVGLGLSVAGGAGLVASAVGGRLTDLLGARRLYVALSLVQATLFACYPLVSDAVTFLLVMAAIGAVEYASAPAWGTLVARSVPVNLRVRTRAYLRSIYNVGFSVGSLACGLVVAIGSPAAYVSLAVANALSFALGALVVFAVPAPPRARSASVGNQRRNGSLRNPFLFAVVGLSGVLTLHVSVLNVALPLWIVQETSLPPATIALVMVLNTVLVVLLQVRASKSADTLTGASVAARRAGVLLATACLVFALSQGGGWIVGGLAVLAGVLLLTVAELLQSVSAWGLPYGLAPEQRLGEYQGIFGIAFSAQTMIGPALTVFLVIGHGWVGWVLLGGVALAAGMLVRPATRRAARVSEGPGAAAVPA